MFDYYSEMEPYFRTKDAPDGSNWHDHMCSCPTCAPGEPDAIELPDLDVEVYQRRREIARVFYWQYIKGENDTNAAIDAISELISYGDDADKIIQMMALNIEE